MPGPLALAGSGEFLPEMEATDRLLLDAALPAAGYALIVPTASALEPGMPEEWADRGIKHFRDRLGIPAQAALILDYEMADERFVPLVQAARLIYFSGGNPQHLVKSMGGSAFWAAVLARWHEGAALAGCSAGAMMLGEVLQNIVGRSAETPIALGVLPGISVIPHFDRIEQFRPGALAAVRERRPRGITLLGVDEVTAAICIDGAWSVSGRGKVLIVGDDGELTCSAGERLPLALPATAG
ncbi:MAG TPA: Type 1 glutamine amidotransferase-like domain-containing protein [Dehalococcoidia bacterium]|nr:Type 1 glutamine amidotransferase-like domain-containing protein [Dehalococcoidia bacterium]